MSSTPSTPPPGDSRCQLHSRPARSTCRRCGLFLCDWCEKLAPSWGAGYCNDCLHFVSPETAHLGKMSLSTMFVIALLAVMALFGFAGVRTELTRAPLDPGGLVWTGAIAVGPLLAVAFIVAQYWRGR